MRANRRRRRCVVVAAYRTLINPIPDGKWMCLVLDDGETGVGVRHLVTLAAARRGRTVVYHQLDAERIAFRLIPA